ncbi:MAG TPA: class I SAM-dependent methyltransferase [Thermoanaerobaculia bacterium]
MRLSADPGETVSRRLRDIGPEAREAAAERPRPVSPDGDEISSARDYYRRILPFYEKESVARAHLAFWRGVARSHPHRRILEIGAGLGRITAELARIGEAVGLDVSLEMLAAASRRAGRARFVAADARRPAFGGVFDLIVAPGDPISHMTTLADRRRALRAVARQLAPGGTFVLDGLYRRRNEVAMPRRRIPYAKGVLRIEETWFPIGHEDLWHARYRYDDRRDDGSECVRTAAFVARAWNPATIRDLFAEAGLEITETWGDFDRRPFRRDSSRLLVTARRAARFRLPVRTSGTRAGPLI